MVAHGGDGAAGACGQFFAGHGAQKRIFLGCRQASTLFAHVIAVSSQSPGNIHVRIPTTQFNFGSSPRMRGQTRLDPPTFALREDFANGAASAAGEHGVGHFAKLP